MNTKQNTDIEAQLTKIKKKIDYDKKVQNYVFHYRKDHLGSGQFGEVYKCTNIWNEQTYAIKIIRKQLLTSEYTKKLVQQEIETLQKVRSPYIVNFHEKLESPHNIYMITELCDGMDFKKYLQTKGKLSEEEAIEFTKQIVEGFLELFKNNIVHRDLKPANLLMKNGQIKIADFGFAKIIDNFDKLILSSIGSPLYMSPQQLRSEQYSYKCDVWSLGIILYQMIYNRLPWPAQDVYNLIKQVENNPLDLPQDVNICESLKIFIRKCLAKEENERYSWQQAADHIHFLSEKNQIQTLQLQQRIKSIDEILSNVSFPDTYYISSESYEFNKTQDNSQQKLNNKPNIPKSNRNHIRLAQTGLTLLKDSQNTQKNSTLTLKINDPANNYENNANTIKNSQTKFRNRSFNQKEEKQYQPKLLFSPSSKTQQQEGLRLQTKESLDRFQFEEESEMWELHKNQKFQVQKETNPNLYYCLDLDISQQVSNKFLLKKNLTNQDIEQLLNFAMDSAHFFKATFAKLKNIELELLVLNDFKVVTYTCQYILFVTFIHSLRIAKKTIEQYPQYKNQEIINKIQKGIKSASEQYEKFCQGLVKKIEEQQQTAYKFPESLVKIIKEQKIIQNYDIDYVNSILEDFMMKLIQNLRLFKNDINKQNPKSIMLIASKNINLLHTIGDWICDSVQILVYLKEDITLQDIVECNIMQYINKKQPKEIDEEYWNNIENTYIRLIKTIY